MFVGLLIIIRSWTEVCYTITIAQFIQSANKLEIKFNCMIGWSTFLWNRFLQKRNMRKPLFLRHATMKCTHFFWATHLFNAHFSYALCSFRIWSAITHPPYFFKPASTRRPNIKKKKKCFASVDATLHLTLKQWQRIVFSLCYSVCVAVFWRLWHRA